MSDHVSVAPLHRHRPRLGLVFFGQWPDCHSVLCVFAPVLLSAAALRQQRPRERDSNRRRGGKAVAGKRNNSNSARANRDVGPRVGLLSGTKSTCTEPRWSCYFLLFFLLVAATQQWSESDSFWGRNSIYFRIGDRGGNILRKTKKQNNDQKQQALHHPTSIDNKTFENTWNQTHRYNIPKYINYNYKCCTPVDK